MIAHDAQANKKTKTPKGTKTKSMKTMKLLMSVMFAFASSFLFATVLGAPHLTLPFTVGSLAISANLPKGILASSTLGIDITQIATELGAYFRVNNKEVVQMVYQEAQVAKYMRVITKVKGRFPASHSVSTNVIQGFTTTWAPLGITKFKVNELTAYHQKVNFEIVPADILNTWLAELYTEGQTPEQQPISQYIAQKELYPKVVSDIEYLSGHGAYDAADLGTFGKSMNGLHAILTTGRTDTKNPMYVVGMNALTDTNIVDEVTNFERKIPTNVRRFVTKIFMSTANLERYMLAYENTFGRNINFTADQEMKTRLGKRVIIGLDCLNGYDDIFATPDNNFLKLIDVFDAPAVTDVQRLDYKVKIFMEFWLGIGFWMNQMVIVNTTVGSGSGLNTDNDTYYLQGKV